MTAQLALLPEYLGAHLVLTLVALAAAAAIALPAGIWVARHPRTEPLVLGLAGAIQTVPGLALLAAMVPALALLGRVLGIDLATIGPLPALIGLTLYGVLPILRNTVTGIAGVDPALVEAARGVGMSGGQMLRMVQLPLASPVIVAGVRTAAVWIVGTATLATPVGATSLGNYIFAGLQTRNASAVLVGSGAAAALALGLDALVRMLEVGVRTRRRGLVAASALVLGSLTLGAGAQLGRTLVHRADADAPITIGAKTFTEQYVLAAILAEQVTRATERPTRVVASLGSTVAFDALRSGAIDAYVDYTGTIWATVLRRDDVPEDRAAVLATVTRDLAATYGIQVASALGFENTYALALRAAQAAALGVTTISALAPHAPTLAVAADYELFARPEWQALTRVYGLGFREQRTMDPSLMYAAVAGGAVDVIGAFSTDGRLAAYDLRVLADDRRAIPPYDAIVLVSPRLPARAPDVVAAFRALAGRIDDATMRAMNAAVDHDGRLPADVARRFLDDDRAPPASPR